MILSARIMHSSDRKTINEFKQKMQIINTFVQETFKNHVSIRLISWAWIHFSNVNVLE